MKDEIKEILDNTLEYLEGIDETRNTKILTTNETNILLDYITNLQEGNHNLLEEIEDMQNKNNKLIEENKELYESIEKDKEIERLNNILNKLEKYLIECGVDDEIMECCDLYDINGIDLRNKLKELKEGE